MKKIGLLLIIILITISTFGQRRVLTSAWNFLRDGFLDDAKEAIDKAAAHPDTKDDYRTFWYKAMIYHDLAVTDNARYKNLCDETCLDIAYENYLEALKRNFIDPEHQNIDLQSDTGLMQFIEVVNDPTTKMENSQMLMDIFGTRFPFLVNAFYERGFKAFQEEQEFKKALEDFEKAMFLGGITGAEDLEGIVFAASRAAFWAKEFESSVEYHKALIELKYGETDQDKIEIYQLLAKSYEELEKIDEMIKTLEEGIEKYPELSYPLIIEIFNYYVNSEQNEEAYKYISMAIEKNPDDPQFYVIKGALLEDMGRRDEAKEEYTKAIEKEEGNYDANYSLGAYYYNTAVDTLQWADDNILITNFSEHERFKKIADGYFEQALPYLEKAREIQPNNLNVLNTLRVVYYRLQKMDEYAEVQKLIDELSQ
jgi:tetratricopeptide (TPR) repeat protein